MNFESHFNSYLKKTFLKSAYPTQKLLKKSLLYSLKAKASRFRPQLCFASTEALGQNPRKILPWAIAIEMIHTGSLIHDDMPVMDDAKTRRAKLCNHHVFGEDIALLAGTCLFVESFSLLRYSVFDNKRKEALDLLISKVGFQALMSGQALDLKSKSLSKKNILKMMELKTGSLISACVLGPLLLWGKTKKEKQALTIFSKNLGIAYQLADDFQDQERSKKWLVKEGTFCLNKSLKALKSLKSNTTKLEKLTISIQKKFLSPNSF
ncbi:MAG: polyprenyl synthetase family protein [Bdellovibrionaceae bacterium]|nr:polyprenyl synthetase family protein [Pseudobdellovibrionaceae bacterium]